MTGSRASPGSNSDLTAARVKTWKIQTERWRGPPIKIAMVADLHACEPFMGHKRIDRIVEQVQGLGADMIALLGDYPSNIRFSRAVAPEAIAERLARLTTPLGVYNVFGNHDWYQDKAAIKAEANRMFWHDVFDAVGIRTLENEVETISVGSQLLNIAGLGSQRAFYRKRWSDRVGNHDLPKVLRALDPEAFSILLAHEPDIFAELPKAIDLTLSGHTHGGQIRLLGQAFVVPSYYGQRYAYGHVRENGRDLVVSGGLGCTTLPIRIGVPSEITVVELAGVWPSDQPSK